MFDKQAEQFLAAFANAWEAADFDLPDYPADSPLRWDGVVATLYECGLHNADVRRIVRVVEANDLDYPDDRWPAFLGYAICQLGSRRFQRRLEATAAISGGSLDGLDSRGLNG